MVVFSHNSYSSVLDVLTAKTVKLPRTPYVPVSPPTVSLNNSVEKLYVPGTSVKIVVMEMGMGLTESTYARGHTASSVVAGVYSDRLLVADSCTPRLWAGLSSVPYRLPENVTDTLDVHGM